MVATTQAKGVLFPTQLLLDQNKYFMVLVRESSVEPKLLGTSKPQSPSWLFCVDLFRMWMPWLTLTPFSSHNKLSRLLNQNNRIVTDLGSPRYIWCLLNAVRVQNEKPIAKG